jgi:[protein-PII] uridylyltransferase
MTAANRPSEQPAGNDALTDLAERTARVDHAAVEAGGPLFSPGFALLAVGGYGRRQLFPHSDVDLLLLFESERLAVERKEVISAFLQRLWDAGMRVSHSVRTPADCTEVHDQNVELNISLLDQRYLAGDRALYAVLADKLPRFFQANAPALVRNLSQLTRERHAKYANTFYHLEPNVKETPGGMRDYQLVCWLEQLREAGQGRMGAADPAPELREAFGALARLRAWLHRHSGRDNNVLSFDAQDAIAEEWRQPDAAAGMREYYRHARAVYRAAVRALDAAESQSSSLLAQFRDWRSRLTNADFSVLRDRVHLRAPQQLEADPALALRLFEFVARHGLALSPEAAQRLEARLPSLRAHFGEQPQWPALSAILTQTHAHVALRAMHETGVLTALLPEMEGIECLVVRDFYHRYTVDEHTLVAIEHLKSPAGAYGELMGEVRRPAALRFALLLHDAGKASADEGHVTASAKLATAAMARLQVPSQEREAVLFLIGKHLELSAALQSRDVFDPQTIRDVAHQVATVERLKELTLLTYADISAVNPGAMTPWRAGQLWQLYLSVYNELTRELDAERIEALPSGPPERVAFLQGFPTRYLRTHAEAEIDAHMALEEKSRARGVAIELERLETSWQLTLVTGDRPGLFAAVAGTLSSFGMNILKAEAFSNRVGLVLDTFAFADPHRTLDLNPSEVERLRTTAERVVLGKADVQALLRNRPKPALPSRKARIPARVSFNSDGSHTATLVEIVAEDRPGLLYDLASAMSSHAVNIEVVLIDTQAHKAIDVFYVTKNGSKLDAETQTALAEALGQIA